MTPKYTLDWLIQKHEKGENPKYIYFWGHTNKFGEEVGKFCFSQWFESPFTVDGITYKTAEHWMMAQKAKLFNDEACFDKIIAAVKPGEVKEIGRQIANFDDKVWNGNKFEIVVKGNFHKFGQNEKLKEYLLNTGDRILVEASPVDAIWGIGMAQDHQNAHDPSLWRGPNLLGFAIMEARDLLG